MAKLALEYFLDEIYMWNDIQNQTNKPKRDFWQFSTFTDLSHFNQLVPTGKKPFILEWKVSKGSKVKEKFGIE